MARKRKTLPRSTSSLKIQGAVRKLKAMSATEHVQLLVKAKLMTQKEADEVKRKIAESDHNHH